MESRSLTVALWRDDKAFYYFDSKPRDKVGKVIGAEDWSEYEAPGEKTEGEEEYGDMEGNGEGGAAADDEDEGKDLGYDKFQPKNFSEPYNHEDDEENEEGGEESPGEAIKEDTKPSEEDEPAKGALRMMQTEEGEGEG